MSKQSKISLDKARIILRDYSEALELLAEDTAKSVHRLGPWDRRGWRGAVTGFIARPALLVTTQIMSSEDQEHFKSA